MPLHPNGQNRIRRNLQQISEGKRPQRAIVGVLTETQLLSINTYRINNGLPKISAEIIFLGKHLYASRCLRDGYSIEDVILQITNALDASSVFDPVRSWTVLRNPTPRTDKDLHTIYDAVVLECTSHAPNPELFSVVPKGDGKKQKAPR